MPEFRIVNVYRSGPEAATSTGVTRTDAVKALVEGRTFTVRVQLMCEDKEKFGYHAEVHAPDQYGSGPTGATPIYTRGAEVSMAAIGAASPEWYEWRVRLLEQAITIAKQVNERITVRSGDEAFQLVRAQLLAKFS